MQDTGLNQALTRQRFPLRDGYVTVPSGPGLGIELDDDVVERYRAS